MGDVQPSADAENSFLEFHSWEEYGAFVYGDLRRVHRMGLIACQYRAAEWRHKEIELAAHDLLQLLDETSA